VSKFAKTVLPIRDSYSNECSQTLVYPIALIDVVILFNFVQSQLNNFVQFCSNNFSYFLFKGIQLDSENFKSIFYIWKSQQ